MQFTSSDFIGSGSRCNLFNLFFPQRVLMEGLKVASEWQYEGIAQTETHSESWHTPQRPTTPTWDQAQPRLWLRFKKLYWIMINNFFPLKRYTSLASEYTWFQQHAVYWLARVLRHACIASFAYTCFLGGGEEEHRHQQQVWQGWFTSRLSWKAVAREEENSAKGTLKKKKNKWREKYNKKRRFKI